VDDGHSGSQSAVVETCVEGGDTQALGSDAISVGLGNAGDQAMEAQASQIVGDPSGRQLPGLVAEQRREMLAHVLVSEGALGEKKQEQDMEQSLDPWVCEAQGRRALVVDSERSLQALEGGLADEAVMADALDVEQTSIGGKAYGAQLGEIYEASADGEVAGVVDCRLGSECLSLLVILLDAALLVVDVQRRHDAVGDDPGAPASRVRRVTLRSNIRLTWLGRPMSRLSRITCSKKTRPVSGWSRTWVRENSACRMESW